MAILLLTYCSSSIRSARRDAQTHVPGPHQPPPRKDESWVEQALEESRAQNGGKGRS
ncbi:unnamed protein product [Penicillium roqueforti FM164]|uniref:Genomic scaffold, ProqFM164S01 n=2 Tax=Penicillium roqueforti TaxID=5082 RepID=W6PUM2_PENRF|nr:unnamed protein product [Penicillium roqueforti FM164]